MLHIAQGITVVLIGELKKSKLPPLLMFIAGFFFTVGHPYWGAGDVCVVMCRTREPK